MTPGMVIDVSAMLVETITRRRPGRGSSARSCFAAGSPPCSGSTSTTSGSRAPQRSDGAFDLKCARLKAEHIAGSRVERTLDCSGRGSRDGSNLMVTRMATTGHAHDAAIAKERGDLFCIDGRRHDDETKIVARLHRLPREGERESA